MRVRGEEPGSFPDFQIGDEVIRYGKTWTIINIELMPGPEGYLYTLKDKIGNIREDWAYEIDRENKKGTPVMVWGLLGSLVILLGGIVLSHGKRSSTMRKKI